MSASKLIVYILLLVQYRVNGVYDSELADQIKSMDIINMRIINKTNNLTIENEPKFQKDTYRNEQINKKGSQTRSNSKLSNINNGNNDFNFLITGGYRPENNPLTKFIVSMSKIKEQKFFGDNHVCTGSILTKKAILTAAHCVAAFSIKTTSGEIKIIVGTPRRLVRTENTQVLMVDKIIPHPKFLLLGVVNDIAIIKLKDEIRLDDFASILPIIDRDPSGLKCTAIGWGRMLHMGPVPDEAVSADVIINSDAYCRTFNIKQEFQYRKGMICVSDSNNSEVGICHGDSGGPLICDDKVAGIASAIIPAICGGPNSMSFYTDVYYYRDCISRNAGMQFPCCLPLIMTTILAFILNR